MATLIIFSLILLCALWVVGFAYLFWATKRIPALSRQIVVPPQRWPKLSVIVPACNEAEQIESAVTTLMAQDYPDLEIILLNDRSTDNTGAIINRLAQGDPRVRAIHIETLPAGWLGKVHALDQGVARAQGEWVLCTDADVHFAPGSLRRAIAFALTQQCDHLALIPRTGRLMVARCKDRGYRHNGFWLDVAVRSFTLLFIIGTGAGGVNRHGSKAFVGVGAFNLVKLDSLRCTPGFSWLRLEPVDDVGLGLMIHRSGGCSRLASAREDLSVEWYTSLAAMFKGLEKNLFGPTCNYLWWLMLIQVGAIIGLATAPVFAIYLGLAQGSFILLLAGVTALGMLIVFSLLSLTEGPREILSTLFWPAGLFLIAAMLLHAALQCIRNDGIDWRGTHYPMAELRQGQRVKLFIRHR
jgi:glycosyltransferase involved in cell wall biosynthesis